MQKFFFVYILASAPYGYLYIGLTSNLPKRISEHKLGYFKTSHTEKHNIKTLVYYETFQSAEAAIEREKNLKKIARQTKFNLIEEHNRDWHDLSSKVLQ